MWTWYTKLQHDRQSTTSPLLASHEHKTFGLWLWETLRHFVALTKCYLAGKCGVRPSTRIVGGVDSSPGDWPWQGMLTSSPNGYVFCGGSLVAPQWLVTASHCVKGTSPDSIYVRWEQFFFNTNLRTFLLKSINTATGESNEEQLAMFGIILIKFLRKKI